MLSPKHVITIDFETYYDTQYSLTKMPTQAYVMDPRFEVIGYAIQLDSGEPEWFSSGHAPGMPFIAHSAPWEDATVVGHNVMFDGLILEQMYGIHPAKYFCTSMGARPALVQKIGNTKLSHVVEKLGLGVKGQEVYNAKGKHLEDFTAEELAAYGEYCKTDVRLSYYVYQMLMAWYKKHERSVA